MPTPRKPQKPAPRAAEPVTMMSPASGAFAAGAVMFPLGNVVSTSTLPEGLGLDWPCEWGSVGVQR